MVPLAGLEPTHLAPEASALSSELQGHKCIILPLHQAFKQAFTYQLSVPSKPKSCDPVRVIRVLGSKFKVNLERRT